MQKEKYQMKYVGVYPQMVMCPGFRGLVQKNDVIQVLKDAVDELRGHDDWELVVEKKAKKGGDE